MRTIESTVEIDAPPERVWEELTDFEEYVEWNPFIPRAAGEARVGHHLTIKVEPPGARGFTFSPTVTVAEPPRRLAWLGRVGVPHLFDGRHSFHLEPLDGGERTRFRQHEVYAGLLVPLLLREGAVQRGFDAMNAALKRRIERRAPVTA